MKFIKKIQQSLTRPAGDPRLRAGTAVVDQSVVTGMRLALGHP